MGYRDDVLIRFDWAAKRILRDKANFGVLEGFVSVLLGENIKIQEILESEANQDNADDKFNRVDIKALNSKGEIIIVEVQLTHQMNFLFRVLYSVSKTIVNHLRIGDDYDKVKKVYSINIIYFKLGEGDDYIYHGTNQFVGLHTRTPLRLSEKEQQALKAKEPADLFPEYYLICVNDFNEVAKTPLEEWMDFLKNTRIREDTTVPGLQEAREKLHVMKLKGREREAYDRHIDNMRDERDILKTHYFLGEQAGLIKGEAKGREEGLKEGEAKGKHETNIENARNLLALGVAPDIVKKATGLTDEEISELQ